MESVYDIIAEPHKHTILRALVTNLRLNIGGQKRNELSAAFIAIYERTNDPCIKRDLDYWYKKSKETLGIKE